MRKAFTLIELLVVVAIIAILISLLVPSFYFVKVITWQTICMANHHDFATAIVSYSTEWKQYLPRPNWLAGENGPGWLYDPPNRNLPEHIRDGQLFPYLAEGTYRCPTDDDPRGGVSSRLGTNRLTSYLMIGSVRGWGQRPYPYLITQFREYDVVMWECNPDISGYWNDGSSYPREGFSTRHRNGLTVSNATKLSSESCDCTWFFKKAVFPAIAFYQPGFNAIGAVRVGVHGDHLKHAAIESVPGVAA